MNKKFIKKVKVNNVSNNISNVPIINRQPDNLNLPYNVIQTNKKSIVFSKKITRIPQEPNNISIDHTVSIDSLLNNITLPKINSSSKLQQAEELIQSYSSPYTLKADHNINEYGSIDLPNFNYEPPLKEIVGVEFTFLTADEIENMATVQIKQSKLSGENSIYDPRMGTITNYEKCIICSMDWKCCPGHPGYIKFPYPLPNPMRLKQLSDRLSCVCQHCHRLILTNKQIIVLDIIKYRGENRFNAFLDVAKKQVRCSHCSKPHGKYTIIDDKFYKSYKRKSEIVKLPISYDEVVEIVSNIREIDFKLIGFPNPLSHPINMIIYNMFVLPPNARPFVESNNSSMHDDLTYKYIEITKIVNKLSEKAVSEKTRLDLMDTLMFHVKTFMDNTKNKARDPGGKRCLTYDSSLNTSFQLSVPIGSLSKNNIDMLFPAWNPFISFTSIRNAKMEDFFDHGELDCVTLTFTDNRTITCTPDHKFLTVDNNWIQAKDIELNKTNIKMSVEYTKCPELFTLQSKYILNFGEYKYDLNNIQDRLKALALHRILGQILFDIKTFKLNYGFSIYFEHKIDAENFINDVELITGKRPNIILLTSNMQLITEKRYLIILSRKFMNFLKLFINTYPQCCDNSPLILIREYLASFFIRVAYFPFNELLSLSYDNGRGIGYLPLLDNMITITGNESDENLFIDLRLLLNKFNIASIIEIHIERVELIITGKDVLYFYENIGVRYNMQLLSRITAVLSFYKYKDNIDVELGNLTNEYKFDELLNHESKHFIRQCRLDKLLYDYNEDIFELPTYQMKVIDRKDCGKKHCYDIAIESPYNSFIANGIISHNSLKAIKQRLAGKNGLIRQNLQGKRTSSCSRSVISPDPNLHVNEVGMPQELADKLAFPERVNNINLNWCQNLLETGKVNHILRGEGRIDARFALYTRGFKFEYGDKVLRNGKSLNVDAHSKLCKKFEIEAGDCVQRDEYIENEQGIIEVKRKIINGIEGPKRKSFKLKIGDIVERKLQDGDWCIFNRQPTLWEGSFRAKQIRIHPYRTFTMGLACTQTYGADLEVSKVRTGGKKCATS
jgi:intein/homing endonuclease